MSYFPISSLFPKLWQIYNYKTPTSDGNMSAGVGGRLAITIEMEMWRCWPKHRFFSSCYNFCKGCRRTPHYLREHRVFLFSISKVQTRRRHPSSSPMTDCCNYPGILSDGGGGGGAPLECCLSFGVGVIKSSARFLPALQVHFTTTPVAPVRQK